MPGFFIDPSNVLHPKPKTGTSGGTGTTPVTTATFPGPGTLTIFLLFAVVVGMSWEPVKPFAYALLVILLVDLLFRAEPNITAFAQGGSSGSG